MKDKNNSIKKQSVNENASSPNALHEDSKGNAGNICKEKDGKIWWENQVSANDSTQDDRSTDELIRSFI